MGSYLPEINYFNETAPMYTTPILIFEKYIPYIFVKDSQLDSKRQVDENPYYLLKLEQLWHYNEQSCEVDPASEMIKKWSYKTDMEQEQMTFMEQVLNGKISTDAKIGYKDIISLGVSGEISSATKQSWERSTRFVSEEEKVEEIKYKYNGRVNIYLYQLIDRYSLFRIDGSKVKSFEVQTPIIKKVYCPKSFGENAASGAMLNLSIVTTTNDATATETGAEIESLAETVISAHIETADKTEDVVANESVAEAEKEMISSVIG